MPVTRLTTIGALFAIAAAVAPFRAAAQQPDSVRWRLTRIADSLGSAAAHEQAVAAYLRAAAAHSTSRDTASQINAISGAAYHSGVAGRLTDAQGHYLRWFALDHALWPNDVDVYPLATAALILRLRDRADSAAQLYARALAELRRLAAYSDSAGDMHRDWGKRDRAALQELALQGLASIERERGNGDSARSLFRQALDARSRVERTLEQPSIAGDPVHINHWLVCSGGTRVRCSDTTSSLAQLERDLELHRFLGDVVREDAALERLIAAHATIDPAVADRYRAELAWVRAIAPTMVARGGDNVGLTGLAGFAQRQRARADSLRDAGKAPEAIRALLATIDRLRADNMILDPSSFDIVLEQQATMVALARMYHRDAQPVNLRAATYWYDSASTTGLTLLATNMPDRYRTTLAEQMADLHAEWALAWLAREDPFPDRNIEAAAGALEEGRARVVQILRGDLSDRVTDGQARSLGAKLGAYIAQAGDGITIDYALVRDTVLIWAFNIPDVSGPVFLRRSLPAEDLRVAAQRLRQSLEAGVSQATAATVASTDRRGFETAAAALAQADADSLTRWLYRALFPDSLASRIPEDAALTIIPDPLMGEVPFAVLRPSDAAPPLALRNSLRFAPAMSLLSSSASALLQRPEHPNACVEEGDDVDCGPTLDAMPTEPAGRRKALAEVARLRRKWLSTALIVGDPVMPAVRRADTEQTIRLDALSGARAEAAEVAALVGVQPVIGSAATEARVRARLPKARLIHLATHGLAYGSPEHAGRSFVALASGPRHDGLLEAQEVLSDSTLALRAVLVVLSACETARGAENRGEGTLGLQRAFLARGAGSMLVSQWRVPDAATRLLMREFYRGWLDPELSLSMPDALRRAQFIVRSRPEFANPVNWAAFQLVGAP